MDVYRYSIDQSRLGLPVLKILLHTNTITVPVPKSLNVRLSCFVTLRITALSYWRQQFPAARVLLLHAELHHLSTSTNGRRRYRLDQSTPSLAAIVRRSPTQCRPPRKLPRSSHESSHAPLALYPPRASHLAFYHHPQSRHYRSVSINWQNFATKQYITYIPTGWKTYLLMEVNN